MLLISIFIHPSIFFKEKLEKEGKKKAAALTEEIDNVENIERKAFEFV